MEYRYAGKGEFVRSKTRTVVQGQAEKDADTSETRQKAQEKEDEKNHRKAEATRRDLDKIAKAKSVEVRVPKKALAKAQINAKRKAVASAE